MHDPRQANAQARWRSDWLCRLRELSPEVKDDPCRPAFLIDFPTAPDLSLNNIPVQEKKLFRIESATRRWEGCDYFREHPKRMVDRFDGQMS